MIEQMFAIASYILAYINHSPFERSGMHLKAKALKVKRFRDRFLYYDGQAFYFDRKLSLSNK